MLRCVRAASIPKSLLAAESLGADSGDGVSFHLLMVMIMIIMILLMMIIIIIAILSYVFVDIAPPHPPLRVCLRVASMSEDLAV